MPISIDSRTIFGTFWSEVDRVSIDVRHIFYSLPIFNQLRPIATNLPCGGPFYAQVKFGFQRCHDSFCGIPSLISFVFFIFVCSVLFFCLLCLFHHLRFFFSVPSASVLCYYCVSFYFICYETTTTWAVQTQQPPHTRDATRGSDARGAWRAVRCGAACAGWWRVWCWWQLEEGANVSAARQQRK